MRLVHIGHMTVKIELDGKRILTDPWFGPEKWWERCLAPRTRPPALQPDDLQEMDAILVSHDHLDHFDEAALSLARQTGCLLIGSERAVRRAKQAGIRRAVPLRRGEGIRLNGLTIQAVCAEHPLARDAIGFVIIGSRTCYFSGDTRLAPALIADLKPFIVDVALVQAACAHYPFLGDDGMSLPEAASLAETIRPRWMVVLHLDCAGKWLDRSKGWRIEKKNTAAIEAVLHQWAGSFSREEVRVKILAPGETWEVRSG